MSLRKSLCALLAASSIVSSNAETLQKEELLRKYAPVFEQKITELAEQGYRVAPIETFFTFGSAEINQTYTDGEHYHDKGKFMNGESIQTYGAFPISYRVMSIWGPSVGYHPSQEGLTAEEYNTKLLNDVTFNTQMAAIRLSGIPQGSARDENGKVKDKDIDSYRVRFFEGKNYKPIEEANIISYIAHRGSTDLGSHIESVKKGTYEFKFVPEREENVQKGMQLANAYNAKKLERFLEEMINRIPFRLADIYQSNTLKKRI